jgi:uncharacterized protein YlzI (FlbEa/FlbD family)
MIRLTRLRNPNPLYLNPDLIERLDSHHETTVHLSNGSEYVVIEHADAIVRLINEQRAGVLALALRLERDLPLPALSSRSFADRQALEDAIPNAVEQPGDEPGGGATDDDGDAPWKPEQPSRGTASTDTVGDGR